MTGTEDRFTPVHKGLRATLYALSGRLQSNDFADTGATRALLTDLENDFAVGRSAGCILCVFSHHASDEEAHIFGAMGSWGNGLIPSLIEDHHALTRRELALATAGHELLAMASPADRIAAAIRLNQAANELFGAYLVRMNREESELVPLMRKHLTDAQMTAMRDAIMAGMPPDRLFAILGWMLPALDVTELSTLLSSVRQGAPPPLVRAIADLCSAKVDSTRWAEVRARTGL
ncbi:MAG TPA: hypothetical protein VFF67_00755 [Thermoplasmata archaeon]|nr:hypothetical protein [Thermoplasmata archaeon]